MFVMRAPTPADGKAVQTFTASHHFLFTVFSRLQLFPLLCTFFYQTLRPFIKMCLKPPLCSTSVIVSWQLTSQLSSTRTGLNDHVQVQET